MSTSTPLIVSAVAAAGLAVAAFAGCTGEPAAAAAPAVVGVPPQSMADALHAVMASDRTVYTRQVVNRLVKQEGVIKASEHWEDDKALPLPAQMFRMGSEMVAEQTDVFSYSLLSEWPINSQNAPSTPMETEGLRYIAENIGENYYGEETIDDQKYFTAVYADTAIAPACIDCHNEHQDSPRTDFKMGEVMGGVVIRIPLQ